MNDPGFNRSKLKIIYKGYQKWYPTIQPSFYAISQSRHSISLKYTYMTISVQFVIILNSEAFSWCCDLRHLISVALAICKISFKIIFLRVSGETGIGRIEFVTDVRLVVSAYGYESYFQ